MHWRDEGYIVGLRRHGETSVIVDLLTREHGLHRGLARGGRSRRMTPMLQPGNLVAAHWSARLEDYLGTFTLEPLVLVAGDLMHDAGALRALACVTEIARLLPERQAHPAIFEAFSRVVGAFAGASGAAAEIARFDLVVLTELGFGLDLDSCAATGASEDLVYVSPKTGRAVSRAGGAPWADRLLPLPAFLILGGEPSAAEIAAAFRLTGHFLERDVFGPRGILEPPARRAFLGELSGRPDR
jgi:DNA repair protein RecO (recombination protein O)